MIVCVIVYVLRSTAPCAQKFAAAVSVTGLFFHRLAFMEKVRTLGELIFDKVKAQAVTLGSGG
jgi:hypothetical protein